MHPSPIRSRESLIMDCDPGKTGHMEEREPATMNKPMNTQTNTAEYLVICRGARFDESLSPEDIQNAMQRFQAWFERSIDEGKIKSGRQLALEGKILSGRKGVTDGPFVESKEGIAGYWFIQAASLEEAVEIAKGDPLLDHGHTIEIRPILEVAEPQTAS
jgi:hypothetical protein